MNTHPDQISSGLKPRTSVVLCTYNGERFLSEQLASIAAQTLLPLELIVCDDRSTDRTVELVESFANTAPFPLHLHRNPVQLGSTRNFEYGMRFATGDIIALSDQDDRWHDDKLEKLQALFDDPTICGVFTDADLIGDEGQSLDASLWSRGHLREQQCKEFLRDPLGLLLKQDVATGATMVFRKQVLAYSETIPDGWVHDAWLTWIMILHSDQVGRLMLFSQRTIQYRVHDAQQTGAEASRVGSKSESLAVRLRKARVLGHEHHLKRRDRYLELLSKVARRGDVSSSKLKRLRSAVALLGDRASLPENPVLRMLRLLELLPAYLRHGGGLASAARDFLS